MGTQTPPEGRADSVTALFSSVMIQALDRYIFEEVPGWSTNMPPADDKLELAHRSGVKRVSVGVRPISVIKAETQAALDASRTLLDATAKKVNGYRPTKSD